MKAITSTPATLTGITPTLALIPSTRRWPSLVAALPLLPLDLTAIELPPGSDFKTGSFQAGRAMLFDNNADTLLFRARMSIAIFAVALISLVYFSAGRMFGPAAAVMALVLVAFEPNVVANGAIVGTDTALACCFFGAVYAFYRYTGEPSIPRLRLGGGSDAVGQALGALDRSGFVSVGGCGVIPTSSSVLVEPLAAIAALGQCIGGDRCRCLDRSVGLLQASARRPVQKASR